MALIVEDGTGLSNSESYASVAFADTYCANMGFTSWTSVADKEAALRQATAYMLQVYRQSWQGYRVKLAQALDWPRVGVVTDRFVTILSTVVPLDVQKACVELALRSAAGALYADQGQAVKRKKVGEIEVEYMPGSGSTTKYNAVAGILAPYFIGGSGGMGASYGLIRS
jgi:hypothetical protein